MEETVKKVNRRFDAAALATIADKVSETGTLRVEMPTPAKAASLRLQFYLWRKSEQDISGDPSFLSDMTAKVQDTVVVFTASSTDETLRASLEALGIKVEE